MSRTPRANAATTAVALGLAVALTLTACTAPNPDPTPSPSPRPTAEAVRPSPSTTPAPVPDPAAEPVTDAEHALEGVVAMVARPEALELVDDHGDVVESLDYLGDPQHAVDVIAAVVGSSSEDRWYDRGLENVATTVHAWDDVLTLNEFHYEPEDLAEGPARPSFMVFFTAARIRGIGMSTEHGVSVGDDWAAASAGLEPSLRTCFGLALESVEIQDPAVGAYRVGVSISQESDQVGGVFAPTPVTDGCV